jgi:hypothetical protein
VRDDAVWRYLLGPSLGTATGAATVLVLDAASRAVGYARIANQGFGPGLIVSETSALPPEAALAVFRYLKRLATERDKPYIRLNLPEDNLLVRIAHAYGGHRAGGYAWQIRLVDVPALLLKLAPVLEQRLAASPFAGYPGRLRLDLYRQVFELQFEVGRLVAVGAPEPGTADVVRLPPPLLAPLLLGYRELPELAQSYHDVSAGGLGAALVQVLFPKVSAFLYAPY